ncbi:glycosyltransferase [Rummeliibacillus sp. JY-2-4R]
MITISLCMIVKNEEDTLARCLDSSKDIVDEINIVDTGSTDKTKEIASLYTDRIFDFKWVEDFAKARNFSFDQATMDYILWLDADDEILEKDRKLLMELKNSLSTDVDSVMMDYHLGADEFGNVTSKLKRNRLLKRSCSFKWIGAVHEYIEVWGNVISSDIAITHKSIHHDTNRNILIYEKKLARQEEFTPRDLFYFANELMDHQMIGSAINYYEKFLETNKGWIEDNISSCGRLADCYHNIGNTEKEVDSILRSFRYDKPRPEMCCRLGFFFMNKEEFQPAIYWFKAAIEYDQEDNGGMVNTEDYTWLPNLQLCVCYDRLGNYELAYYHNEVARGYRPKDKSILHNKKYLETVLGRGDKDDIQQA